MPSEDDKDVQPPVPPPAADATAKALADIAKQLANLSTRMSSLENQQAASCAGAMP